MSELLQIKEHIDVLIIEDELDVLETIAMYLESMDIFRNIVKAHDGVTAISKLNNQTFDLILIDLKIPKKPGLDVVKFIADHANGPNANQVRSVAVVSGALDKKSITKALGFGAKNFLVKPFDEIGFQEKIREVLGIKKKLID